MPPIETFVAYDANGTGYSVDVHGTLFEPVAESSETVKAFSLTDTGEVLRRQDGSNKILWVESKQCFIKDLR